MIAAHKIADAASFAALREEWNALLSDSRSDCLFLTWDWLFTWWAHLAGGRRLEIVTLRSGNGLVGIAPLGLRPPRWRRWQPFRALDFLGTGFAGSDYLDVILRRGWEQPAAECLDDVLSRQKRMIELGQLCAGTSAAAALAQRLANRGWAATRKTTAVCPYINLGSQTWDSYLASLGSQHRYNFNRRLRNLQKNFDVRFEEAENEEQRVRSLAVLIRLHNQRWSSRGGSDAFHTAALVRFHQEFSSQALARGWLRLFVLLLNGRPAAALYGFRYGRVFYFYQSGLDPDFEKYSAGLVTMGLAIRRAIEEGACEYDMLHGDEAYKSHWARERRELERLELYPPLGRGFLYRKNVEMSRTIARAGARVASYLLPKGVAGRAPAGPQTSP